MNAKTLMTLSLMIAVGTACGSSRENTDDAAPATATATETATPDATVTPNATPEPTPEPTPELATFTDGVYVSRFGIDSNAGTGEQHMRTIKAAIERAKATAKKDIWLASDADGWDWNEIVTVPDGINLHGGVCIAAYPMTPPAVIEPAACRTSITGASPALIAENVTKPTRVENLEVRGRGIEPAAEYAFKVPGGACLGRASATAAAALNVTQACTPALDDDGRALPRSSFAAWASSSTNLTFANVRFVAAAAEAGIAGQDGVDGENGTDANGLAAGVNAECATSNGGNGGAGGFWTHKLKFPSTLHPAISGSVSPMASAAGVAGVADLLRMTGNNGTSASGFTAFDAQVAESGTKVIDDSFVAGSGLVGIDGRDGAGGSGAGGGAVGVSFVFEWQNNAWKAVGEGAISYNENILESMPQSGETRGGNGGAGGAGGCGGTAATAGQGGASSVALVVKGSEITVKSSTLVTGNAGNGGKGGVGGMGGIGGAGAAGAQGTSTAQYNINGLVVLKPTGVTVQTMNGVNPRIDASDTKGVSMSKGGNGGDGADGQSGENGATGGSGAGGASVGLFGIGSTIDVVDVTYQLGNAGLGGRSDDDLAIAENGIRAPEVAQN